MHRVIQFKQEVWLKGYIDMNTELRKMRKMNLENVSLNKWIILFSKKLRKIQEISNNGLVTTDKRRKRLISELNYHSHKRFSDHLMAVEMKKTRVKMTKPLYLGMYESKILMYKFLVWLY